MVSVCTCTLLSCFSLTRVVDLALQKLHTDQPNLTLLGTAEGTRLACQADAAFRRIRDDAGNEVLYKWASVTAMLTSLASSPLAHPFTASQAHN